MIQKHLEAFHFHHSNSIHTIMTCCLAKSYIHYKLSKIRFQEKEES